MAYNEDFPASMENVGNDTELASNAGQAETVISDTEEVVDTNNLPLARNDGQDEAENFDAEEKADKYAVLLAVKPCQDAGVICETEEGEGFYFKTPAVVDTESSVDENKWNLPEDPEAIELDELEALFPDLPDVLEELIQVNTLDYLINDHQPETPCLDTIEELIDRHTFDFFSENQQQETTYNYSSSGSDVANSDNFPRSQDSSLISVDGLDQSYTAAKAVSISPPSLEHEIPSNELKEQSGPEAPARKTQVRKSGKHVSEVRKPKSQSGTRVHPVRPGLDSSKAKERALSEQRRSKEEVENFHSATYLFSMHKLNKLVLSFIVYIVSILLYILYRSVIVLFSNNRIF